MIASDGLSMEPGAHSRGAGTHARVLGRFVRDEETLSLGEAIARMMLLPARRLEGFAPWMKRKGHVQPGADAELVVFDPMKVSDNATFEGAMQYWCGIFLGCTWDVAGRRTQGAALGSASPPVGPWLAREREQHTRRNG